VTRDFEVVVVDASGGGGPTTLHSVIGSEAAGHLSPDNRTLFIVIGVTVGIVIVVLTMSAIVCFKKHAGIGRPWWHFGKCVIESTEESTICNESRFTKCGTIVMMYEL
jgi:hypothetical protein